MEKKALVILADGFEEIEAFTPIDVLRRAEVNVTVAGLEKDMVRAAHGVTVKTDTTLDKHAELPDVLVLPGGSPGAENLAKSSKVKDLIIKMNNEKKLIAAICASPALVLAPTEILDGKIATCYPGLEKNFSTDVKFVEEKVVQDGNIITSRGPATALPFALMIVENLIGEDMADMLAKQTLFSA